MLRECDATADHPTRRIEIRLRDTSKENKRKIKCQRWSLIKTARNTPEFLPRHVSGSLCQAEVSKAASRDAKNQQSKTSWFSPRFAQRDALGFPVHHPVAHSALAWATQVALCASCPSCERGFEEYLFPDIDATRRGAMSV